MASRTGGWASRRTSPPPSPTWRPTRPPGSRAPRSTSTAAWPCCSPAASDARSKGGGDLRDARPSSSPGRDCRNSRMQEYQGVSVRFQHPPPVGRVGQQDPGRDPQRPGQMRDRGVHGDDQVHGRDRRRRLAPIGQTGRTWSATPGSPPMSAARSPTCRLTRLPLPAATRGVEFSHRDRAPGVVGMERVARPTPSRPASPHRRPPIPPCQSRRRPPGGSAVG